MDVAYITVKASKLPTVPIVDGQILALSDQDGLFYDMEGKRRAVSGQVIVTKLPDDIQDKYKDCLYIVPEGNEQGIHIWTGSKFAQVASANTDEKVRSEDAIQGKSYLVGSPTSTATVDTLRKHKGVYIDHTTGMIHAQGFSGGAADNATSAESATRAGSAKNDELGQDISKTYIKSIKPQGTTVTVTYGDGSTDTFTTQDTNTHHKTNIVFADSDTGQANSVASDGQVHMNVMDNTSMRSSHLIKGSGSVKVTSDDSGNLTITGQDTWRPNTASQSGYVAAGVPDKVWGTDSDGNPGWKDENTYIHPDSHVTPGTYTRVSIDAQGHVFSGTHPTTLKGYEITDAMAYTVLDSGDLNHCWGPGVYVGCPGNTVANKPPNTNMDVFQMIAWSGFGFGIQLIFHEFAGGTVCLQYMRHMYNYKIFEWERCSLSDTVYTHPEGPGFEHLPDGGSEGQVLFWGNNGTGIWGSPEKMLVDVMTGSTQLTEGKSGVVPAPPAGPPTAYLRNDGSWSVPPNTTYSSMVGATEYTDGESGLVPKPKKSSSTSFLGSDGQWHSLDLTSMKPVWREYIPE